MSEEATLLRTPLFRWGMPAASTALIVALAFLVVEDQTVRLVMLVVAAVELLVVPQILKRVTQNA